MKEIVLNKREEKDNLYRALQRQSLEELQRLSGEIWTDYNEHDPGVTLNDAVNYALTELDYRLHFGLPDYLVESQRPFVPERFGLYSSLQVFPTSPVTRDDYRKLITDSLEEVENLWIYPEEGKEGWYEMLVELSPVTEIGARNRVEKEIRRIYNRNRNLGEGLRNIRFIERKPLVLVADIETEGGREAVELLAEVYWEARQFFIQGMNYRRVEEVTAEGVTMDEILEGPELKAWVGCLEASAGADRSYAVPLLYKRLSRLKGVKAVCSLYFTDGNRIYDDVIEPVSAECSYTVALPSEDCPVKVRLRNGKNPVTVEGRKVGELLYARYAGQYGSHNVTRDLRPFIRPPAGVYRPMFTHAGICEDLPECYGVNSKGIASDEPERRKMQAGQLKGYLQLFDGLIVQGLEELQHLPALLDIHEKVPEAEVAVGRQEQLADFWDKLYGEESDPVFLREYNFYDENRRERLERRRRFLRGVPQWGRDRFKGLDLQDMNAGNMPGIKAYVSALLGLEGGTERPVVNVFPLYNLKIIGNRRFYKEWNGNLSHNFVLDTPLTEQETERIAFPEWEYTEPDFYRLKQVIPLLHYNLIFEGLFRGGVKADNFRMVNLWQESGCLLVFHHCEGEWDEWINLGRFGSARELVDAADCLRRFLVLLNRKSETFYVVEHHLLNPEECFTVTVVWAGWSARMADARFREGCEKLVSSRLPAHLEVRFRWLNAVEMWKFEKAYYAWRKEISGSEVREEIARQLREAIK